MSISYVVVVSLFEGVVSALGDDHSHRVITRYYDFLIPLMLILSFGLVKHVSTSKKKRIIEFVVAIVSVLFVMFYFPSGVTPKIADSVPVMGLIYNPAVMYVVGIFTIGLHLYALFAQKSANKTIGRVLIPLLVLIIGISAQNALIAKIGTQKAYFDVAGQSSKPFLTNVVPSKIIVIGGSKPEVVTSKFWIDKPGISDLVLAPGSTLSMSQIANYEYALFLGTSQVEGAGSTVTSGDKFVLIKVAK